LPGTRLKPIDVIEVSNGVELELELELEKNLAAGSIGAVAGGAQLLIPAAGLFDVEAELKRASAELADAQKQVTRLESLLGGDFSRKAPPETVERERERLTEQRERLQTLERRHQTLTRLASARRE
jgi:valyl-tRNA synthetase